MKENVILSADNASAFTRSIDLLDTGIQELRRIAHNMMPENLVKFGLVKALEDYCQSIAATDVLKINFSALQMENYTANINLDITIYRIIQELINNTIKHANATEIIVQLFKEDNKLNITVEDNGKGFDVKNINNFKGAGWTNIINRVNYLKGKTDVVSNEKEGTSVNIEIPLL
jgi:signal transduction histidine kinase